MARNIELEREILQNVGNLTKNEVERYLNNGTIIYEAEEYISLLRKNEFLFSDEQIEEEINFIKNHEKGQIHECDVTVFDGVKFFIVYAL